MNRLSQILVAALIFNQFGCAAKKTDPAVDDAIPKISSVTFASRAATSFTINWTAGTDDKTAASALQYKVVYSTNNNISTADSAVTNGILLLDWTTNVTTGNISSLSQSTNYYIAVLVRDADSNVGIAAATTHTLCSGKRMYLAAVSNGNLGGITGADSTCNTVKPAGFGTVKALISSNAANPNSRSACNTTATPPGTGGESCTSSNTYTQNWVLLANASICTSDYEARIGTTNTYATMTTVNSGVLSATPTSTFGGFNIAWGQALGSNCTDWTSTSGTTYAGSAASNGSGFISGSLYSCASAGTIYCVEQ